jgi:DNA replication protein DnaC
MESIAEVLQGLSKRRSKQELEEMRQKSEQLSGLKPEEVAIEQDRHCVHCGELLIPIIKGVYLPWRREETQTVLWAEFHGCDEEAANLSRQKAIADEKEWANRMHKAGLTGRLASATFETFTERADWPGAMECKSRAMIYTMAMLAGDLGNSTWLVLYGNYGTGKSHLAAAIVRHALAAGWQRCYFRAWTSYLGRFKAAWDRQRRGDYEGECEDEIIRELQRGDLVVIDDLDKRAPTDWALSTLYTVLNRRWQHDLPTVLTFNYGPNDSDPKAPGRLGLERFLGKAVIDRMIDACFDTIAFEGPSHRSGLEWNV